MPTDDLHAYDSMTQPDPTPSPLTDCICTPDQRQGRGHGVNCPAARSEVQPDLRAATATSYALGATAALAGIDDEFPNGLRAAVLADFDRHKERHGESCDCDWGLSIGELSVAELVTDKPEPPREAASYTNPQTGRGVATGGNIPVPEAPAGSGLDARQCASLIPHGPHDAQAPWRSVSAPFHCPGLAPR